MLKRIATFLIPAFLFLSIHCSQAQKMRVLDVASGLSTNSIKGIIQDDLGYMWFGTTDGLNVYNGIEFKTYGCSYHETDHSRVGVLNIMSILLHRDGRKIWVGTQSSSIYLFDPEKETFKEINLNNITGQSPPNLCYSMTYDLEGNLWICTDCGLYQLDEKTEHLTRWTIHNSNLPVDSIHSIYCDNNGTIWIGTTKGLFKYNHSENAFVSAKIDSKSFSSSKNLHITAIAEGPSNTLWIGTWENGLAILDKENNTLKSINPSGDNKYSNIMRVRSILSDSPNLFWICTNYGLFKYDIVSNSLSHLVLSTAHPNDNIYSSYKDREGGIWIGTFFSGVFYLSPRARQIECYTPNSINSLMNGSAVSSFLEDSKGYIYITSENGGLSKFDPSTKKFIDSGLRVSCNNIHDLCIDTDKLYIATYAQGLKVADLTTREISTYAVRNHPGLVSNNIFSLFKSKTGDIFIGTDLGCSVFSPSQKSLVTLDKLRGEFIYDIEEDIYGNYWFATYYNGLFKYESNSDRWVHYTYKSDDNTSLPNNKTVNLNIDTRNNLWICTEGNGVCRYDYSNDCFKPFTLTKDGQAIKLAIIYGVLDDAEGRLWFSSNDGIWECMPNGSVIRHLTHEDGLQSNQHNSGAVFRSSTGKMYFGGVNGFNIINAENIHNNNIVPIVTVHLSYKESDGENISSPILSRSQEFTLPRYIKSFSLDFECLSYTAPHKNEFAYKIDGEPDWTYTKESSVTFLNFPYGKHVIKVRGRNGDGYWSRDVIELTVNNLPPIFKSNAAKLVYAIIGIALLFALVTIIKRRQAEKAANHFNEIRREQEKETYQAKINFFTHVAHEIKTPVTLIKAPLEVVIQNEASEGNKNNLIIIKKNTDRLLNLVNQLLDFKKISSDGHQISMVPSYPQDLTENVVSRFDNISLGGINISYSSPQERVCCVLDSEAYTKIVSNLITNAVKHAKSQIEVQLEIISSSKGDALHLSVKDDGCGIPESEQHKIFETFYQVNPEENPKMHGVGLGLSLVKLLVQKHNGAVYIDNTVGSGCCFCVDIPYISPQTDTNKELERVIAVDEMGETRLKILIAEDTADMLDFISNIFCERYDVYKAGNGKEALDFLKKHEVDIIISDLSMPIMNGFELLQNVRNDDMLCHIPVIILTVEGSLETRIKGLEYGADAYIEKPFSASHLLASVSNLIARRDRMRKQLLVEPSQKEGDNTYSNKDKEWFEKVTLYIQQNISETEIPIENIANVMNMSRSSFQRKIKGLTGLSPVELIRTIRLKKAAELLSTGDYRINEVAYMVGFNKPSYFSAMFKKQFGSLPKDYVQ